MGRAILTGPALPGVAGATDETQSQYSQYGICDRRRTGQVAPYSTTSTIRST